MKSLGAKGFRPMFLLAGVHAALVVPLWVLVWSGRVALRGPLQGIVWHAHEMIHGFTLAVIAGFLLTAVGNWTGRQTLTGGPLWLLAGVWTAARLALILVEDWPGAILDLAVLPLLIVGLGRPLLASRNTRNAVFLVLLAGLWGTNLLVYLDPGSAVIAHRVAVYLIAVIILVVAGRVVPMFTRNTLSRKDIHNRPWLDRIAIAATALVALLQPWPDSALLAPIAAVAGTATLARMAGWGSIHVGRHPMLWVLHLGHAAVGLALLLSAVRDPLGLPPSVPFHTLTVGGIGLLTIGMMARVSLGHTGRAILADRWITGAFVCVAAAAVVRAPASTEAALWVAAGLWSVAFAVFTFRFLPILTAPRPDGKPG